MRLAWALAGLVVLSAARAGAEDETLAEELERMKSSNIDAAMRHAKADATKSAALIAALLASCRDKMKEAAALAQPAKGSDEDDPAAQLAFAEQMLSQKAAAFRAQAAEAKLALPEADPRELASKRAGYRAKDRERDLHRAETDLANSLGRLKGTKLSLDPAHERLLSILRSIRTELERGRDAAASAAGKPPRARWKEALEGLDQDAADLGREIRLLELALKLRRADELSFDSKEK